MRHLHSTVGRQEALSEVIHRKVTDLKTILGRFASDNPITLCALAIGFGLTWIVIIIVNVILS
jgi:hypothetical protein